MWTLSLICFASIPLATSLLVSDPWYLNQMCMPFENVRTIAHPFVNSSNVEPLSIHHCLISEIPSFPFLTSRSSTTNPFGTIAQSACGYSTKAVWTLSAVQVWALVQSFHNGFLISALRFFHGTRCNPFCNSDSICWFFICSFNHIKVMAIFNVRY